MTGATDTSLPVSIRQNRTWPLWPYLTAILLSLPLAVPAIDQIEISLGSLTGPDWNAEDLTIKLDLGHEDSAAYLISAKEITHPSPPITQSYLFRSPGQVFLYLLT